MRYTALKSHFIIAVAHIEKCKVMHLGYNNPKADYVMDGSVLQSVSEEKDLGVIVSDDFRWEKTML